MLRRVTAEIDLDLSGPADLVFSISVADHVRRERERLSFEGADGEVAPRLIRDASGTRLHRVAAAPGVLRVRYEADVAPPTSTPEVTELDTLAYLRPSRYCPSDEVFAHARAHFHGLSGRELVRAVAQYAERSITYSPGLSRGTDTAATTLATGRGVCRDYAHVVIALLRAMDVPARYAACYAPGLVPMDFHAVAEVFLEGGWYVIDATGLADRRTLVRIATGRDAADCAFLSFHGAHVALERLHVDAALIRDAADPPADAEGVDSPASAPDSSAALVALP
ncbi:transglutaminase family protein [Microbacterium sp. LRZ72]|uniref:transglutaminase-like domain-containing protein n=1 Tax=Microbacterium sp. LRZ72 TaxID=2942481 RepID=UPI0029B3C69E|nr:transglutaminase family protein [Microbacterium sp. LRZ72]MDX2377341.1 transglutaminase family protein [Microbacterium sp. LRZ72]